MTEASTIGVHIYIAYAPADKVLREKLEKQLSSLKRNQRITCWHKDLVRAGSEPRREIEMYLQRADLILLLISPDFLAPDEWCKMEIESAMHRHEAGHAHVIPIIIRPTAQWKKEPFGKLQALPRNNKPITTWTNHDQAYEKVAEEIGIIIETFHPERPRQSGVIRIPSLPPALTSRAQRRSKVVQQIYKRLVQSDTTALVLTGIGGAGKSTLANLVYHYAKKQVETGKRPFTAEPLWIAIHPSFTMADLIATVFDALGKPLSDFSSLLPQEQAEMLFQALNTAPRLVIFDQFEHFLDAQTRQARPDQPVVREWLALLNRQACTCRVLLTSRLYPDITDDDLSGHNVWEFPVPDLETKEGIAFLRDSLLALGIKPPEDELQKAVQRCDGHPLSLRLLVSLLEHRRDLNMTAFLNDPYYGRQWKGAIASKLLNTIYQEQLDQVHRQLLQAFSIFREPVSLEAAGAIMEIEHSKEAPYLFEQLDPILVTLRNLHLLQDASLRRYQLHPIVASYAHDHFGQKNEQIDGNSEQANHLALPVAHAKAAEFYQQQAEKTCPPREQRRSLLDLHDFVEATWHWCQAERQKTAYESICQEGLFADLQRCGGNTTLFELYLLLRPDRWQPAPLQAANIYNEFGEIQRTLGQKHEAYSSFEKAVSIFQDLQNPEGIVKALNNLGAVCKDLGLLEQALAFHQQALQTCEQIEVPALREKATSTTLNNIGVISLDFRQKERAFEYFEQALSIQSKIDDPGETARTLMNIGKMYDIQKKGDEAYKRYLEALAIFQKIGDRGGQATILNHLGVYFRKKPGKKQEAWRYHIQALHIFREIGDRSEEAITLQHLGQLSFFRAIKRDSHTKEHFEESLAFYLYALHIFRELQLPEKGEIPQLVINELRSRLGEEQLATFIAAIEPRTRQIIELALTNDRITTR